ncbi:hypothetical protein C0992_010988 [Termitomyces sp. T32_za158]|nr:hypothetical protein C0992_010988 [Termitomyces sp. T32_za158]
MNIFTKTRRYRELVKEARQAHTASLVLAYKVQEASITAQAQENNKPATIKAKAEEAAIAYMERKVRYNMAKRNYQKLCGPGSVSQSSFNFILELEVDTTIEEQ